MKLKFGIKEVVAIGIGTALFVVLTNVQVPFMIIPNTALQSRVAVLTFFSAVFGPIVGGAIGIIGHALGDALFYGSVWWSWVFPDGLFGIIVGLFAAKYAIKEGGFTGKNIVLFNVIQVIANALAWIVLAPVLDILIYAEPANKVFTQGVLAFVGNIVVAGVLISAGVCVFQDWSKILQPFQGGLIRKRKRCGMSDWTKNLAGPSWAGCPF